MINIFLSILYDREFCIIYFCFVWVV